MRGRWEVQSLAEIRSDGFQQPVNDFAGGHSFGLGSVVYEDAVTKDGMREGTQVFRRDVGTALQQGAGLGPSTRN